MSRLFFWRAKFWLSKNLAGRSQHRILVTRFSRYFSLSRLTPLDETLVPHRGGEGKTTFFSAARGPQHAARGPQHKCGPRVARAALRHFAGHITMLIFWPSAGHISWRRGPHLARGPHFLHHCCTVLSMSKHCHCCIETEERPRNRKRTNTREPRWKAVLVRSCHCSVIDERLPPLLP